MRCSHLIFALILSLINVQPGLANVDASSIQSVARAIKVLSQKRDPLINKMLSQKISSGLLKITPCDYDLLSPTDKIKVDEALREELESAQLNEAENIFLNESTFFANEFSSRAKVRSGRIFIPQGAITEATQAMREASFNQLSDATLARLSEETFSKKARLLIADIVKEKQDYALYAYLLLENGKTAEIMVLMPLGNLETVDESAAQLLKEIIEKQTVANSSKKLAEEMQNFKGQLERAMIAANDSHYTSTPDSRSLVNDLLNQAYRVANPTLPIYESELTTRYVNFAIAKKIAASTQHFIQLRPRIGFNRSLENPFAFEWLN